MKLDAADYVEIMRAAHELSHAQMTVRAAREQAIAKEAHYMALMRKHGLDPTRPHDYHDREFTITPHEPPVDQMLKKAAGRRK